MWLSSEWYLPRRAAGLRQQTKMKRAAGGGGSRGRAVCGEAKAVLILQQHAVRRIAVFSRGMSGFGSGNPFAE